MPFIVGALLKAAFICAEIIDMKSELSLKDQLLTNYGGGFELHSWTNLPHGSGKSLPLGQRISEEGILEKYREGCVVYISLVPEVSDWQWNR